MRIYTYVFFWGGALTQDGCAVTTVHATYAYNPLELEAPWFRVP